MLSRIAVFQRTEKSKFRHCRHITWHDLKISQSFGENPVTQNKNTLIIVFQPGKIFYEYLTLATRYIHFNLFTYFFFFYSFIHFILFIIFYFIIFIHLFDYLFIQLLYYILLQTTIQCNTLVDANFVLNRNGQTGMMYATQAIAAASVDVITTTNAFALCDCGLAGTCANG